jgi:F-type H+-transporting ATPase subunit a
MTNNPFHHELVWQIGPMLITRPVVTTWGVMAVMVLLALWIRRSLRVDQPGRF